MICIGMLVFPLDTSLPGSFAQDGHGYGIEKILDLAAEIQPHFTGHAFVPPRTLFLGSHTGAENEFKGPFRRPDNIPEGYVPWLFQEIIAPVRAPLAAQDLGFLELLENLFQVPWTDELAPGDVFYLGG